MNGTKLLVMTENKRSSKNQQRRKTEVTASFIIFFWTIVAVVWFGVRLSISEKRCQLISFCTLSTFVGASLRNSRIIAQIQKRLELPSVF
jgi:hypothetical protein